MKTVKQIKEEKRQTYLKSNQLNVGLIKKLDKLSTGEVVIAVYAGKNSKVVTDKKEYKIKQVFINNEFVSYIEPTEDKSKNIVGRPKQNNVQYKRNIKPEHVKLMDDYLVLLKKETTFVIHN